MMIALIPIAELGIMHSRSTVRPLRVPCFFAPSLLSPAHSVSERGGTPMSERATDRPTPTTISFHAIEKEILRLSCAGSAALTREEP